MKADRSAHAAGIDDLLVPPESLDEVRRERTWQADLAPLPVAIEDDPGARPAIALVVAGRWVVWAEFQRCPSGEPEAVARILSEGVLRAAERCGVPETLEARHSEVVAHLGPELESHGIRVERKDHLDAVDDVATGLLLTWAPGQVSGVPHRPCVSSPVTWAAWGLPDGMVEDLFHAAAEYFAAAPWHVLDSDAALTIVTSRGRAWSLSVLGQGETEYGIVLYSEPSDQARMIASSLGMPSPDGFSGRIISLTFDRPADLDPPMRREIMRAGWPVAAHSAYPRLITLNTPGGGMSIADARALLTALGAVTRGAGALGTRAQGGAAAEWTDTETGAELRLHPEDTSAGDFSPGGGGWLDLILDDVVEDHITPQPLPPGASVHRLRVVLEGPEPPVWRSVEVPSDLSLYQLNTVVEAVVGWSDLYPFGFDIDGAIYGEGLERFMEGEEADAGVTLAEVAGEAGTRFLHIGHPEFGWRHELTVEAISAAEPELLYPRCLGGERACPPDVVWGAAEYEKFLAWLRQSRHLRSEEPPWTEEVDWDFDPERFDPDEANRRLEASESVPPLDPECEARLQEVEQLYVDALEKGRTDARLVAEALLVLSDYARMDPRGFMGVRKLEVLAAGALHAAGMAPGRWRLAHRPTLEELAESWGVSSAAIASRSVDIRERSPGVHSLLTLLAGALRGAVPEVPAASAPGDGESVSPPPTAESRSRSGDSGVPRGTRRPSPRVDPDQLTIL